MTGIVKEDFFLTEQQNLYDGIRDCSKDEEDGNVSFRKMNDALLKMALDVQLDSFDFTDDNVDRFVDYHSDTDIIGVVSAPTLNMDSIDLIERNKNLCSMKNQLLTVVEEERIAEMMRQEAEDMEKYGFCIPSTEKNREAEVDELLLGLGYDIEDGVTRVGCENTECEDKIKVERGDPILRELAKERMADLREQRVDEALQKLLLEPLPHVVRVKEEGQETTQLQVVCEDATSTASVADEDICNLVQKLRKEFEDDGLALADHESIRALARSIMEQEFSKNSGSL
jgi:hypothetical protein